MIPVDLVQLKSWQRAMGRSVQPQRLRTGREDAGLVLGGPRRDYVCPLDQGSFQSARAGTRGEISRWKYGAGLPRA